MPTIKNSLFLQGAGCKLLDSAVKDLVDGHREGTLNTLWRILLHFKVRLAA